MPLEELSVRCVDCGTQLKVVSVLVVHNDKAILNAECSPTCLMDSYNLGVKDGRGGLK